MTFTTINPSTGEPLANYALHTDDETQRMIEAAHDAWLNWRTEPFDVRGSNLNRLADLLDERIEPYAALMADEMGKPISQARAEVRKCATVCRYYAEHGADFLADEAVEVEDRQARVSYQPLGVVFAIMPWNFPFWQVIRFAAPTLMAGNTALLKHAPSVMGCAGALEALFTDAGFPSGVFQSLIITHDQAEAVISHDLVQAVTLTGSTRAGRRVAELAGRALKKLVLELGGSDPYVVLEDADLDRAVEACVMGRMINTGQSCIAAKRLIVVDAVRAEFTEKLATRIGMLEHADPHRDPDIGPMARHDLRDTLHDQVARSLDAGATRRIGGELPDGPGAFYPPTLLENVGPGMPAYEEELFGPVACIVPARDESDALRIANDTSYGLGGAVFTGNEDRGLEIARTGISAGSCFVNGFVASDPRLPFGGTRASGYGRELSHHGIREFVNAKTVVIVS